MNEPKMGFFQRLYYSIAGFSKYRYFLRQGTGTAVVYLLVITLVLAIVTSIPSISEFNRFVDELTANFDNDVPDFAFRDGKLKVYSEMPIVIDSGGTTIVIDTSPDAESRILSEYDVVILITEDKLIQKVYVDKTVTSLSTVMNLSFDREDIRQSLPLMKTVGIFLFAFIGIFFIIGKFISVFIVSLAGQIINSIQKTSLSYRSIYKLSVYALTLPLLLCTILDLLPVDIPFLWLVLVYYVIAIVYMYGAIRTIRRELNSFSNGSFTE